MIDSKKLITVFLILAVLASASVLIFSNPDSKRASSQLSLLDAAEDEDALPSIGENAFVEALPKTNYPYLDATQPAEDFSAVTKNSTNLTQNLFNLMTREVLSANPQGPQVLGGKNYLSAPTEEKLSQVLVEEAKNFKIKDFENSTLAADIKIVRNYKDEDIFNYLNALNKIFNETIANERFVSMVNERVAEKTSPDDSLTFEEAFEILTNGDVAYDQANERAGLLAVPTPLIPLHKSLLAAIRNPNVYFSIITDFQNDPIKAAVVLQNNNRVKDKIAQGFKNFQSELAKIDLDVKTSDLKNKKAISVELQKIFGIKTANAQIFVPTDCLGPACVAFHAAVVADINRRIVKDNVTDPLKSTLLQVLKNQLVTQMTNQVINWVKGGGKPRFITDWKGFLIDAADVAAGTIIQEIEPKLCQSFGPLITVQLQSIYNVAPSSQVTCTLSQVVANIEEFYNSFSNGGWVAFGALTLPSGNYFGSLFEVSQIVSGEAEAKKESAKAEGEASGGFLSTKVCPAGSDMGVDGRCLDRHTNKITESQVVTPGVAIGNTVATALDAPLHNIVNANDVAGVAAAIANLLINKLITSATGLLGV